MLKVKFKFCFTFHIVPFFFHKSLNTLFFHKKWIVPKTTHPSYRNLFFLKFRSKTFSQALFCISVVKMLFTFGGTRHTKIYAEKAAECIKVFWDCKSRVAGRVPGKEKTLRNCIAWFNNIWKFSLFSRNEDLLRKRLNKSKRECANGWSTASREGKKRHKTQNGLIFIISAVSSAHSASIMCCGAFMRLAFNLFLLSNLEQLWSEIIAGRLKANTLANLS